MKTIVGIGLVLTQILTAHTAFATTTRSAVTDAVRVNRSPRMIVGLGFNSAAPGESGIFVEGDPVDPTMQPPPVIEVEGLTLREAKVFLENPLTPYTGRLVSLNSPGLVLARDMIADVHLSSTATRLPPKADGSYNYLPFGTDDMAFNQVNAYYLAHKFVADWFVSPGWGAALPPLGIRIHTDVSGGDVIGQYEGGYAALFPVDVGDSLKHTAKDADIVRHEVAHTVLIPSFPHSGNADEYYAFHEGMANYYAYLAGPNASLGEWVASPGGVFDMTLGNNDATFYHMNRFIFLNGPYEKGRILTGALRTIRQSIGTAMEELVAAAACYPAPAGLREFADAIRRADIDLFEGSHLSLINSAFAARGSHLGPLHV